MRVLITGIAGFVGSTLAIELKKQYPDLSILGIDNFSRPGSKQNRQVLEDLGARVYQGDLRNKIDLESLPAVDTVIDAAANPSVLAGTDGNISSSEVMENNLGGTINVLEYCKTHNAGFIFLSTSRVYSISELNAIKMETINDALRPLSPQTFPDGFSALGVAEAFTTQAPISLYGASKLTSEIVALEYAHQFGFPVWINRCGVLAGAGQFGRPDQGIFTYWINSYLRNKPLKYIGFGGEGLQVRDCLHPRDLIPVITKQMDAQCVIKERICNFGGGIENCLSLAQLSAWCEDRCNPIKISSEPENRDLDIPWMVMDNRKASNTWGWTPITPINDILEEILEHARGNPSWLELSIN